ncbi:1447_t:CDS:1 [Paraglomus occultum]|uniref:1447_t:CDS:1 n=1 Tax=Paraglomus occultum TaxID=144539 RepID=A0A9N8VNH0_9GLOM|nr:1447_t:CDS:1 [Paraglomus occultum]
MVNFEDSKYKTKNDIINAVDEDGKQVFSKDEKSLFIDYSIKSVKDAKEVAKLILKSKEARKKKKEDDDLKKYLEGERFKNSLAYQIVNKKDEMVDEAINWLKLLIVTDDSPKSKDERKKRRDEIILEIKKKEKEQGEIGRKIAGFKSEKRKKVLEKQREEKSLSRREGLMTLLDAANKKDTDEITNKNGEKILLNKNIEINDYSYIDNG